MYVKNKVKILKTYVDFFVKKGRLLWPVLNPTN
jgi:hypothetical protein